MKRAPGSSTGRCLVLALTALLLGASPVPAAPVTVELLPDSSAVVPGKPLRLGMHFRIEPGWHIYWRNPGDSGMATEFKVTLPPGFEAGPVQWPLPNRFEQPGDLVVYGYEDEVLLYREIQVPTDLTGDTVTLGATAQWFACREACVIGRRTLTLELPVRRRPEPAHTQVFARWQQLLPVSAAAPNAPVAVEVVSHWPAGSRRAGADIRLRWRDPANAPAPGTTVCYPGQNEAADVEGLSVARTAAAAATPGSGNGSSTGLSLTLAVTSREVSPVLRQDVLVVYEDAHGRRHGLDLTLSLNQGTDRQQGEAR